jgi:threonine/homoserine/homoserine lactone efflux protein
MVRSLQEEFGATFVIGLHGKGKIFENLEKSKKGGNKMSFLAAVGMGAIFVVFSYVIGWYGYHDSTWWHEALIWGGGYFLIYLFRKD